MRNSVESGMNAKEVSMRQRKRHVAGWPGSGAKQAHDIPGALLLDGGAGFAGVLDTEVLLPACLVAGGSAMYEFKQAWRVRRFTKEVHMHRRMRERRSQGISYGDKIGDRIGLRTSISFTCRRSWCLVTAATATNCSSISSSRQRRGRTAGHVASV